MIVLNSIASERLCLTLMHSLWQVALVALAAWGIGLCLGRRRDNASYVVHATALTLGLIAAPITYAFLTYGGSTPVDPASQSVTAVERISVDSAPVANQLPPHVAIAAEPATPAFTNEPAARNAPTVPAASTSAWRSVMPWLAGAYFAGLVFMLARLAWSALQLERLRATAQPITDGPVFKALTDLCGRWALKTAPVLAHAEQVVVPNVVGLLKPTILLPSAALTGLSIDDLELILAHELAHVRRHDLWINLLQRLAEAVLFFNPAMWWLSRRVSTLREYCCDDRACAVVPDSDEPQLRYAQALLHTVELQRTGSSEQVAALAAAGRSPSELRRRVARLFGEPTGESIRLSQGGVAVLLAGAMLLLVPPTVAETALSNASSISVSIMDSDNNRVSGVGVELRGLSDFDQSQLKIGEFVEKRTYGVGVRADESGQFVLDLGKTPPMEFGLRIKEPGYGPYWATWNSSDRPEPVPAEFTVQLDKVWSVGGVVVDEAGQPIQGAELLLYIVYKRRPGDTRQLKSATARVTTASDGTWRFDSVPESNEEIGAEITHPNHCTIIANFARSSYEVISEEKPVEPIVIPSGLVVAGRVTDSSGQPVVGATVQTNFYNDVRQAKTDSAGRYRLRGCKPMGARIVVSAPGKAMELEKVVVGAAMDPVDFVLQEGGKVRIEVLDENGVGIPRARIYPQRWRGMADYSEFEHVDQFTNEAGVWEWDEAPLDVFEADIWRPGGMQLPNQKIQARDEAYVFSPPSLLKITGKVFDAKTEAPIEEFRVSTLIQWGDSGYGNDWHERESYESAKGEYAATLDQAHRAMVVRIEADGYRIATSRAYLANEGQVTEDIALVRADSIVATVVTPDGASAAGAKIALGEFSSQITIKNGDIDDHQTYAQRLDSDAKGRFELAFRDEDFELVITHDEGFAHMKSSNGPIPAKITLTPWARVEGIFRVGSEPVPRTLLDLSVGAISSWGPNAPRIHAWYTTSTDKDGRYEFSRVFPGEGSVRRSVPFAHGQGATVIASSSRTPATFVAGQKSRIDLGGSGRAVVGKLLPPADFDGRFPWHFALVTLEADRKRPQPPKRPRKIGKIMQQLDAAMKALQSTPEGQAYLVAEMGWPGKTAPLDLKADRKRPEPSKLLRELGKTLQERAAALGAWRQSTPEGQAYLAAEQTFMAAEREWQEVRRTVPYLTASVSRDGSFRIDDTPPDDYELTLSFAGYDEPAPAKIELAVAVPSGEVEDPALNLGELQLQPLKSP